MPGKNQIADNSAEVRTIRFALPGSYTVEAAVLVSLILLILMTWFYLAFSFHDRLVFRALAYFYTEGAGRMLEEPVSEEGRLEIERLNQKNGFLSGSYAARINASVFEERFMNAADGLLFITRPAAFRLQVERTRVQAAFESDTHFPAVLPGMSFLYEDHEARGTAGYGMTVTPETFVRAARGLIWRD